MNFRGTTEDILKEEARLREGGGQSGRDRQKKLNRLTVRERLDKLLDDPSHFFEINLWAGFNMYKEWGDLPGAGVVTGIGEIKGHKAMIIANDATVKAGAFFPQSVKKVLRAQKIAFENRLPLVYLVDSSGVFLPLQDEIFPDEDDFGRIFRNNAIISAAGITQFAAIMGNCIAGGGYLPVLCDQLLMTEGSGLYLAGPALVKAAIGQVVDTESLGGAKMHASLSGTVDYLEKDDESCLEKIRDLFSMLPEEEQDKPLKEPYKEIYDHLNPDVDVRNIIDAIVDEGSFDEYKAEYGKTIVCGFGKVGKNPVGIVANQRTKIETARGEIEIGGVLYTDSADKAARFVMDCNQMGVPIVFLQDVVGFMVGKAAEESGIIKAGAKLVSAVSNSIVPKITIIIGNSFGAGNYALCGKAYDPRFILAWPNAKYAVMGASQAAQVLEQLNKGKDAEAVKKSYLEKTDIRYGAARGWVDAIIAPHTTRETLYNLLNIVKRNAKSEIGFHTGVIQV
jgi:acetyl-CoA carboxylase carboxyltransferase component